MAGADDLGRIDSRVESKVLVACPKGHDHLFETGVAGPFPNAVDGDLNLAGAGSDSRQTVGRGQTEVVMAVDRPNDTVGAWGLFSKQPDQLEKLFRGGIAHGVGDVESCSTRLDGMAEYINQEFPVRPTGILGAELHVAAQRSGVGNHLAGSVDHGRSSHPQLMLEMEIRGCDEGVNSRLGCPFYGLPGGVNVFWVGTCETRYHRAVGRPDLAGDLSNSLQVVWTGCRKSGLDDIDTKSCQLASNFELFGARQAGAR